MRKPIATFAALMCLFMLPLTAAAADQPDRPETVEVFDLVSAHPTGGNPCHGGPGFVTNVGEVRLHALPSIESFWAGGFTHATWMFTFSSTDEQGYVTRTPESFRAFVNQKFDESGEPRHFVNGTSSNMIYIGDDGGVYRVHVQFHVTMIDGEAMVSFDVEDGVCLRQPLS